MNRRNFTMAAASMPSLLLSSCGKSLKNVEWEEEVPLNTGEILWVKRADTYTSRSEPGNPLQMGWWPKSRSYKFQWNGQQCFYELDSKISAGAILIYVIEASKTVAIVDGTTNCAKPGYGEFRWTEGNWQLQPNIDPTLVGQPRNLMEYASAEDGAIPARVTQEWIRLQRFDLPQKGSTESHLSASRIAINCSVK
jgi:hypothetical protein